MAVCLFGGAFDPVHFGHIVLAREVQYRCGVDKMVFLPSGIPPHKNGRCMASSLDRLNMTRIAIESFPFFQVSSFETEKSSTSYSIDTIRHFRDKIESDEPLFFAMGFDAFLDLATWRSYDRLTEYCHLIVTTRTSSIWPDLHNLSPVALKKNIGIFKQDESLPPDIGLNGEIFFMEIPVIKISSTNIRQRAVHGDPIDHLCNPGVHDYIVNKKLYLRRD